jgi:hypothetical protein
MSNHFRPREIHLRTPLNSPTLIAAGNYCQTSFLTTTFKLSFDALSRKFLFSNFHGFLIFFVLSAENFKIIGRLVLKRKLIESAKNTVDPNE